VPAENLLRGRGLRHVFPARSLSRRGETSLLIDSIPRFSRNDRGSDPFPFWLSPTSKGGSPWPSRAKVPFFPLLTERFHFSHSKARGIPFTPVELWFRQRQKFCFPSRPLLSPQGTSFSPRMIHEIFFPMWRKMAIDESIKIFLLFSPTYGKLPSRFSLLPPGIKKNPTCTMTVS